MACPKVGSHAPRQDLIPHSRNSFPTGGYHCSLVRSHSPQRDLFIHRGISLLVAESHSTWWDLIAQRGISLPKQAGSYSHWWDIFPNGQFSSFYSQCHPMGVGPVKERILIVYRNRLMAHITRCDRGPRTPKCFVVNFVQCVTALLW
jgi:hypothetical protein